MEKSHFWWFCWLGLGNPRHIATKTPLEKSDQNLGLADPHPPQLGQKTKFFDRCHLRAPLRQAVCKSVQQRNPSRWRRETNLHLPAVNGYGGGTNRLIFDINMSGQMSKIENLWVDIIFFSLSRSVGAVEITYWQRGWTVGWVSSEHRPLSCCVPNTSKWIIFNIVKNHKRDAVIKYFDYWWKWFLSQMSSD